MRNGEVLSENAVTSYTVEDQSVPLATASKNGYTFEGWYLEQELQTQISEIDTQKGENVTLYAKFSKTAEAAENGNVALWITIASLTVVAASAGATVIFIRKKRGVKNG